MNRRFMNTLVENAFHMACLLAVIFPLAILAILLWDVVDDAKMRLGYQFLTSMPSRKPAIAGVFPALVGSAYLIVLTLLIALPFGMSAALYLEEYGRRKKLARLIEANIGNLASVPSVIYGLLGLELFVRMMGMGHSLIAGSCTLALLVIPVIITATREALRAVPMQLREAALGLGATKWQTTWRVVIPSAMAQILTGVILSVSRAFGETAPLVVIGAATYMAFLPDGIDSDFTALPIQIFNWVSRPQKEFLWNAAAGIVVLLITLFLLNLGAIILRGHLEKKRVT